MTAFWVFLALLVGAVACRVAWTRGRAVGETVGFERGVVHQRGREAMRAESDRMHREFVKHSNRSEGGRKAAVTRKAQRAARGES